MLFSSFGWSWRTSRCRCGGSGTNRGTPALDNAPHITLTGARIPGDPLNLSLIGSENEVASALAAAGWYSADAITIRSSLHIAESTIFHRPYLGAPVSNLFLYGHKEDLAFEKPAGRDPRERHHVRFWKAPELDGQGRPCWFGAATFDRSVGFSHTTGQITHHIAPNIDAERDGLVADLQRVGRVEALDWKERLPTRSRGAQRRGRPVADGSAHGGGGVAGGGEAVGRHPPFCHSERSVTESKNPVALPSIIAGYSAGSFDSVTLRSG
ncbi:MAG: LssY C-terminal domain-containing protein [Chthoniobacter sp.]